MAYSDQDVADFIRRNNLVGADGYINKGGIYNSAQQHGVDAAQLDRVGASQGWWGTTGATDWITTHGLAGGLGTAPRAGAAQPANPYITGTAPTQVEGGGQMTSYPAATAPAGGVGSTGMPNPASAVTGANPYMPSGGAQPRANPYMPAGGARVNYGNDPRMGGPSQWGGMPSTANQGLAGAADYLWQNPNTMAMGAELTRGVNNNLQRNILPGIRGGAMAAGGVGGSRQGVAEGLATGESMAGLAGALANLYGNQYNQDRNFGLQDTALDFGIHRGNLQDMRTGQLDQLGFLDRMAGWNQQGLQTANQAAQTPFTNWQQFVGPASQMAGLGGSTSQNMQGNPYLGAIGGYMAGQKLFGG